MDTIYNQESKLFGVSIRSWAAVLQPNAGFVGIGKTPTTSDKPDKEDSTNQLVKCQENQ